MDNEIAMPPQPHTLTQLQKSRQKAAHKIIMALAELDGLLYAEAFQLEGKISNDEIQETIIRKLHVGPLPIPCRIKVIDGQSSIMSINENWVMNGYFGYRKEKTVQSKIKLRI